MKNVTIYTDGACSGNPGPGGWGAVLIYGDVQKGFNGHIPYATNSRMELIAVIEGLKLLKEPCKVTIVSDSAYVVNCFKHKWYELWIANNWKNSQKKKVLNRDLWEELFEIMKLHEVEYQKTKGHSDDPLNNWADELARGAVKGLCA